MDGQAELTWVVAGYIPICWQRDYQTAPVVVLVVMFIT